MDYFYFVLLTSTILIPTGVGIVYFKRFAPNVKPFLFLVIIGMINELVMYILHYFKFRNLQTLHIYTIAELVLIGLFYFRNIKNESIKRYFWVVIGSLAGLSVSYIFMNNNFVHFNSIPRAAESFVVLLLGGYYFYEKATTGDSKDPFQDGVFIINGCVVFYFMASFITFALSRYMEEVSMSSLYTMYIVHAFVNAFCNLVIAFGLWKSATTSYTFSSQR